MTELVTYLININGSDERLALAALQLEAMEIEYTRVQAFDGRKVDPRSIAAYDHQKTLQYLGRDMLGGEIGCYLSHVDCVKRFLASEANYGLVLEDDIQLAPEFPGVLSDAVAWLKSNPELEWNLINLGNSKLKIKSPLYQFGAHTLYTAHYFPVTTTAILWSRSGATEFIDHNQAIFAPIDNNFRYWLTGTNKGLSINPPLVTDSDVGSEIEQAGAIQRQMVGRSSYYGIKKKRRLIIDMLKALRSKYF